MNDKAKRLIKKIIPQTVLNSIRGAKQRITGKFAPVIHQYNEMPFFSLTDDKVDYVGGYYDITPFSKSGRLYLMLKLINEKSADIVLYDLAEKKRRIINKTRAVNRQQGSRLRWSETDPDKYYYNDYDGNKYVTVRCSINSDEKESIGPALYDLSSSAGFGLALNFSRLGKMRPGYGYLTVPYTNQTRDELLMEGIDYVSFKDKSITRLFYYSDLIKMSGWAEENIQRYYINHICINPSGTKFTFFWIDSMDSDAHLRAALFVFDFNTNSLSLLEDTLRVSHYAWKNDNEILVTLLDSEHECAYVVYDVNSGRKKEIVIDGLRVDGHPSWVDSSRFITDTYPDHYGYQTLYMIDCESGNKKPIIKMYHTSKCIGEMRCDMHPRLSPDKKMIAFDGNIHGVRNVYVIDTEGFDDEE